MAIKMPLKMSSVGVLKLSLALLCVSALLAATPSVSQDLEQKPKSELIVEILELRADRTFLLKSFPDNSPDGEDVEDPIGRALEDYNQTFLEIGEYLGQHLPEIVKRLDENTDA